MMIVSLLSCICIRCKKKRRMSWGDNKEESEQRRNSRLSPPDDDDNGRNEEGAYGMACRIEGEEEGRTDVDVRTIQ